MNQPMMPTNQPGMPMQMPPQGFMPPGQQMMGYQGPMNLETILNQIIPQGAFIKQKFDMTEVVTGCDTKNRYYVYGRSPEGKKQGKKIFKCKETSGWCERNCLPGNCRSIDMKVKNRLNNEETCLILRKACQCTYLCLNRPVMEVILTEGGREVYLGKVVDPFDCLTIRFQIFDDENKLCYTVKTPACQMPLMCNCPCESCQTVLFTTHVGSDAENQDPCSTHTKKSKGCMKAALGNAQNFDVPFPAEATWKHKALLLAVTLFIDYRMFEDNGKSNSEVRVE